jgi:uncharacterized membrane protein YwaF
MRTSIIILAGFALWGLCLGGARLLLKPGAATSMAATAVFLVLWLLAAATNMWFGITQAGYSLREELPIFLLIFLIPSIFALFVKRRFL